MDRDESDIKTQVRTTESIIARDRRLLWIQRGVVALILVIALYLSVQAVQDGLSVWKAVMVLLVISLVFLGEMTRGQRSRKLEWEIKWSCLKCGQEQKFDCDATTIINKNIKISCDKCGTQHVLSFKKSVELCDPSE